MLSVSDRFLAELRVAHVVVVAATVRPPGSDEQLEVPVLDGQVVIDSTALIRRTCSVTIPWTLQQDLAELSIDPRLLPFGGELTVYRGVRYGDQTLDQLRLGRFRIDSVAWSEVDGVATIEGRDRMAQVSDEALLGPYHPCGSASSSIVDLVQDVFGDAIAYDADYTGEPSIVDAVYTGDRAETIDELARSVSKQAYFDANGDLHVVAKFALGDPVWDVDAGDDGVLVNADESLERLGVANGVMVQGQQAGDVPPVSALVTDDDVDSPTYYGGPFGRVVKVIQSASVQSTLQAASVAQAELDAQLGLVRQVTLASAPNPALEPGDTVTITFADGRVEQHLLQSVTVPLNATDHVAVTSKSVWVPEAALALAPRSRAIVFDRDAWAAMRGAKVIA